MIDSEQGPAVLVSNLTVRRGPSTILDQLDLALASGEVVAVLGRSGSGKSTLLAALAGLVAPESGDIWVGGQSMVAGSSDRARSKVRLGSIGLVFQSDELLPELTIAENVSLPLRLSGRWSRGQHHADAIGPLLDSLGIGALADRLPSEVSGGQLQRAAIARAVVHQPSVVLADEPTGSLDEAAAHSAIELLIGIARARHTAVVVVTHDPEIASMCDRRMVLEQGRLVSPTEQLRG